MSGGNDGQQPERGYQLGDLVEDLSSGEAWTVDDYHPGGPCHPAWVVLGRETREGGVVTDRSPEEIHLVTPVTERAVGTARSAASSRPSTSAASSTCSSRTPGSTGTRSAT